MNLEERIIKRKLCEKTPSILEGASLKCAWCHSLTYSLESHHYPILKSEGGLRTVDICANCHSEFHYLLGAALFRSSQKLIELFNLVAVEG